MFTSERSNVIKRSLIQHPRSPYIAECAAACVSSLAALPTIPVFYAKLGSIDYEKRKNWRAGGTYSQHATEESTSPPSSSNKSGDDSSSSSRHRGARKQVDGASGRSAQRQARRVGA
ncbi:hypothetical protein ACJJTC_000373 [Scirpophaga incertulas]